MILIGFIYQKFSINAVSYNQSTNFDIRFVSDYQPDHLFDRSKYILQSGLENANLAETPNAEGVWGRFLALKSGNFDAA